MIKIIIETLKSKLDINGNSYYAVRITKTSDACVMNVITSGDGEITALLRKNGFELADMYVCGICELPKKQFRSATKNWRYACKEAILEFVSR